MKKTSLYTRGNRPLLPAREGRETTGGVADRTEIYQYSERLPRKVKYGRRIYHHRVTEWIVKAAMYKITATIIKPGGAPVEWVRFSAHKLEFAECEKMFFRDRKTGKSVGEKISVENFRCEKMTQRDV